MIEQYANRADWLAKRGIGGSDIPSILGHKKNVWQLWLRLRGYNAETEDNDVMREGRELESVALDWASSRYGYEIAKQQYAILRHEKFSWATASPDGLGSGKDAGLGFEVKTGRDPSRWGEPGIIASAADFGLVPLEYLDQVYWSLACSDSEKWIIVAMISKSWGMPDLRIYEVLRNPAHQARILLAARRWYERHVIAGEPPAVDGSDECRRYFSAAEKQKSTAYRQAEPEEDALVEKILALQEQSKGLEAELKVLRNELSKAAANGNIDAQRAKVTWATMKGRDSVDVEILRSFPDAAAACIREGKPYDVMRVVRKKK